MAEDRHDGVRGTRDSDAADGTFARLLGESWQTSGDGIYRLAENDRQLSEDLDPLRDPPSTGDEDLQSLETPGRSTGRSVTPRARKRFKPRAFRADRAGH
jgi:hypothetical protein